MTEDEVLALLQKVGAFYAGHFVFVSGLHASTYINKNAIYPYTDEISRLCRAMAERYAGKGIDAIVGPATGGIILSQWVAHHLSEIDGRTVYAVYADKDVDDFVIKRGYDALIKGKKTVVVEDLITTGGSLKKVIATARAIGADVAGAIAVCNRGNVTKEMVGNPPSFASMLTVQLEQWSEASCDLCTRGIPINTNVGHGKDFLAKKAEL